jgi:hypothetical protein
LADYQDMIRTEIDYQRRRLYKRLKKADGRLIVEYWAGAKRFLNSVPGIKWEKQGTRILIKGENLKMKNFKQILEDEIGPEDIGARDLLKYKKAIQKADPELYKQLHKDLMSGEAGAKRVIAFLKKNAKVYK